jgi:uncharacterized membrane protein
MPKLDIVEAFKKKSTPATQTKPPDKKNWFYKICGDSRVDFREWKRLEWILFALLLGLGMYAVGGLSGNVVNLKAWKHVSAPDTATLSPYQIEVVIAVQAILLEGVIFGVLYLYLLRNFLGFLVALILLVLSALLCLALLIYLMSVVATDKSLYEEIRRNVKGRLDRMQEKFSLDAYQQRHQCCGIVEYTDWKLFKTIHLADDSVPSSCCKNSVEKLSRLNCGLQALLKPKESLKDTINTEGCGKYMATEYKDLLIRCLVEDIIILFFIIAAIILLIILFIIWYRKTHRPPIFTVDPREQENDAESDIIPGTPLKSYISSSQKVYYAP